MSKKKKLKRGALIHLNKDKKKYIFIYRKEVNKSLKKYDPRSRRHELFTPGKL